MKYSLPKIMLSALVGLGFANQSFGQFQTGGTGGIGSTQTGMTQSIGGTQGFGGTQSFGGAQTGTQGFGGTAGASATGATSSPVNGPFGGLGVSGAFGGRGITGAARQDFSSLNAANGAVVTNSSGQMQQAGGPAGTQVGATSQIGGTGGLGAGGLGGGGLGGGVTAFGRTGGLGGIGGLGGLGGGNSRTNSSQAKSKIRTVVTPDIEVSRDSSAEAAAIVQTRMSRIPLPKRIANVAYTVESGIVVIRGEVSSETDKRLAERLVLLEPGVDLVKNEIQVRNTATEQIRATPNR